MCGKVPLVEVKVLVEPTYEFQLLVGYEPTRRQVVVAYRGSSNTKNWVEDFKFDLVAYPPCQCLAHRGFLQVQDRVSGWVYEQVKALALKRGYSGVLLTGHSLGAAVATLGALDLKRRGMAVLPVYTFGEPHVGDRHFAAYVAQELEKYRVIHNRDIVPHVPPFPVYYQPPTEIWYAEGMATYTVCSATNGEDMNCSEQLPLTQLSTDDHHIEHYMALPVQKS